MSVHWFKNVEEDVVHDNYDVTDDDDDVDGNP